MLYVFTFVLAKHVNIEPKVYALDVGKMLEGREVLDFTLEDFPSQTFSTICIQAKNLHQYVVDFEKGELLGRVSSSPLPLFRHSIWYNQKNEQRN